MEGRAVCDGYSEAFKYLLNKVGIRAKTIYGYAEGEGNHAWSMVNLNDKWYHVDITWDDYDKIGGLSHHSNKISYNYFLVTDEKIRKTHKWEEVTPKANCKMYERFWSMDDGFRLGDTVVYSDSLYQRGSPSVYTVKISLDENGNVVDERIIEGNHFIIDVEGSRIIESFYSGVKPEILISDSHTIGNRKILIEDVVSSGFIKNGWFYYCNKKDYGDRIYVDAYNWHKIRLNGTDEHEILFQSLD